MFKYNARNEGEKNLKKTLKMTINVVVKGNEACSTKIKKTMQYLK